MTYQPQFITAPDGSRMVVIPEMEYARLLALDTVPIEDVLDARDRADADKIRKRVDAGEGTMPAEVLNLILDEGVSAVRAWRKYRKLKTAELARRTGLSQPFISKIERGLVYGTRETRRKLAEALNAPLWALDDA